MTPRRSRKPRGRLLCAAITVTVALAALATAAPALAAESAAHWHLESIAYPTNLPLEGEGQISVFASNLGAIPLNGAGEQITITDALPAGVEATSVEGYSQGDPRSVFNRYEFNNPKTGHHEVNPTGFRCTSSASLVTCTFEQQLPSFEQLEIFIHVKTDLKAQGPSEPETVITAEGGEAAKGSVSRKLKVNEKPTEFGVERYELTPEGPNGEPDTEAGSHPYQLTSTFNLNTRYGPIPAQHGSLGPVIPALQRNLSFKLPPGLIGDANVVGNENAPQQCEGVAFGVLDNAGIDSCPLDTAIGVAAVTLEDPLTVGYTTKLVPVFNLVPAPGEPARFGFAVDHVPVVLDTSLETGGQYGVTVSVHDLSESIGVLSSRVTFWGVPEEASHNEARGWGCLGWLETCVKQEVPKPAPYLTLPTSCTGRPTTSVAVESWPHEEENGEVRVRSTDENPENAEYRFPTSLTGCELLSFSAPGATPTLSVEPETEEADTPTGLKVDVHVPQEASLETGKLAEPAVKDTTLTLPKGLLLNPSAANGLEACAEGETEGSGGVGFLTNVEYDKELEPGVVTNTFTEKLPEPLEPGTNFCPNGSKVGIVHIKTPDLPNELEGGVYLAEQTNNPFGSLFAMYIVAQDPVSKVLIKAAGKLSVSATGQITSTFENTPDAPFEDLKLELFNGPRASLTTPPECGTYGETQATFTPWSVNPTEPAKGAQPVTVQAEKAFNITSGPGGSGCPNPPPFAPSFKAGPTNTQAGEFTPFTLTIDVPQADSALTAISSMQLPEGLAAEIASVTPCAEPAAEEGNCGPESEIGSSTAVTGLGGDPFALPGTVYLTGPYDGAPFGLSAVTEATAGPFHLGRDVVRSSIAINPNTAAATINTEASRFISYTGAVTELPGLPEFVEGVPGQIKALDVNINRKNFEFNPTNCKQQSITATLKGAGGGQEAVSAPFQPTNCGALPFAPKFTASVVGQGSKTDGTTFTVKVESPGLGQANIHKVDLTIPASLPSRLTTIQKACLEAAFNANPASCDEGSMIGEGIVHTPVFKNPLRGPAYLVSHGGAAFPDVEFVLQGEGVTVVLDGKTVHPQRDHLLEIRNLAGRAVHELRNDLPGRPAFGADAKRARKGRLQPLQNEPRAADGTHRPERRVHRRDHTGPGDRLPRGRGVQGNQGAEAREGAEGLQEGQEEEQARRV